MSNTPRDFQIKCRIMGKSRLSAARPRRSQGAFFQHLIKLYAQIHNISTLLFEIVGLRTDCQSEVRYTERIPFHSLSDRFLDAPGICREVCRIYSCIRIFRLTSLPILNYVSPHTKVVLDIWTESRYNVGSFMQRT